MIILLYRMGVRTGCRQPKDKSRRGTNLHIKRKRRLIDPLKRKNDGEVEENQRRQTAHNQKGAGPHWYRYRLIVRKYITIVNILFYAKRTQYVDIPVPEGGRAADEERASSSNTQYILNLSNTTEWP